MHMDAKSGGRSYRGWVIFAATYLGLAGGANLIWGITALSKRDYFAQGGLVWSNLDTWGWISVVLAAVQLVTALLLGLKWFGGALVAIAVSVCGVVANFLMFGAYPAWSAVAIACNALVLWAVTAHAEAFTEE
jgi:hypothetical protein